LSFGNKNPETKIKILFRTKKFRNENNTFQKKKNLKERLLCFENENPETKMKSPFRIKKSII